MTDDEQLFAVVFDLPAESDVWPPFATERLWTAKTGTKLHVRVRNTPFYIRGISYGDLILVRPDHERKELVFDRLVEESGHTTVRILVKEPRARDRIERLLTASDCSWEISNTDNYFAVDVPPSVDYSLLRSKLLLLKDEGAIGLQEGAISTSHRAQLPPS
ncbi:MAG TPA: hypothetical protein DGG94_12995 [Micromonosporaceae bacterium]|nr:hypothetical protein [Micromonosporaceae bacterium]HCU50697.1 hypothetical protein [Micromonosporaceae bacterium]